MKKHTFFIFVSYIWTKTLLSLTFHPYKAIVDTLRRPVLFPVIFSPIIGIVILFVSAKLGGYVMDVYGLKREMVAIFLSTTLLSIIFWQALLLYLLGSFLIASWRKQQ